MRGYGLLIRGPSPANLDPVTDMFSPKVYNSEDAEKTTVIKKYMVSMILGNEELPEMKTSLSNKLIFCQNTTVQKIIF